MRRMITLSHGVDRFTSHFVQVTHVYSMKLMKLLQPPSFVQFLRSSLPAPQSTHQQTHIVSTIFY